MKKLLILLILFIPMVYGNSCYMLGDVDGNGLVSTNDLTIITKHILGTDLLYGDALLAADANRDGLVSTSDLIYIRKEILGIEDNDTGELICESNSCYMLGDVDGNGLVSTNDLTIITKHILGTNVLYGDTLLAADANRDGLVSTSDLIYIRKEILGIEDNDTGELICEQVPEFTSIGALVALLGAGTIILRKKSLKPKTFK